MPKKILAVIGTFCIVFAFAPQVFALDIIVDQNGKVSFYQGQVLGDEDPTGALPTKPEERKRENQGTGTVRQTPFKIISPNQQQQLRIKNDQRKTEISIEKRDQQNPSQSPPLDFKKTERMETNQFQVSFPVRGAGQPSEQQEQRAEERGELREQRLEIKSKINQEGKPEFELQSEQAKVKLRGSEMVLDPNTKEITLTTPSGNQHVMTHLPDQAIERMKEAGVLTELPTTETPNEVELEVKEDGNVVYKTRVERTKKLFGLFNRKVQEQVELNDVTGEVTQTEVPANNFFARFLNRLSR